MYVEQVGSNRQADGNNGESKVWYTRTKNTNGAIATPRHCIL